MIEIARTEHRTITAYNPQANGVAESDTSKHAKVFKILDNRESNGSQEYYVQWYKLPEAFNSWVKEDNFDDTENLRKYWNKKRPGRKFR